MSSKFLSNIPRSARLLSVSRGKHYYHLVYNEAHVASASLPHTDSKTRDSPLKISKTWKLGGRLSSVVLSGPTVLWPGVQIPSTHSSLFQFILLKLKLYLLLAWEKDENKRKRVKDWPIFKDPWKLFTRKRRNAKISRPLDPHPCPSLLILSNPSD